MLVVRRHQLLFGYALTLLFYATAFAGLLWGGFRPEFTGAIAIAAAPALVLGLLSTKWDRIGIPLSMWTLSNVVFSLLSEFTDDLGIVGVLTLTLLLYWPIIVAAFAAGKFVRARLPLRVE